MGDFYHDQGESFFPRGRWLMIGGDVQQVRPAVCWELTCRARWLQALSIDLETGLDPAGFKVRAAQGLDAAVRPTSSNVFR